MIPTVEFVVPAGVDDPRRPSGGNVYDRRIGEGLAARGWQVREHPLPGAWPRPTAGDRSAMARLLAGLPDGATVLVDGLIGSASEALADETGRLRVVVLVHMPLAEAFTDPGTVATERHVLGSASAVATVSHWSRQWLLDRHGLTPDRVHVVVPGTDPAPLAQQTSSGSRLLCVAAVTRGKGHDTLMAALSLLDDLDWACTCVGALDLEPDFARDLTSSERVRFTGPLTGTALDPIRAEADLVVSASRHESYGMAVTEALARGIPVVVTDVGGHPEAVGEDHRPGLLVPPDDPAALAAALRRWLTDPGLRARLRRCAVRRRAGLPTWPDAAAGLAAVLAAVAGEPSGPNGRVPLKEVHR